MAYFIIITNLIASHRCFNHQCKMKKMDINDIKFEPINGHGFMLKITVTFTGEKNEKKITLFQDFFLISWPIQFTKTYVRHVC